MSNNLLSVGVDDGHNNTCIYSLQNGKEVKLAMPSRIINGKVNKITLTKKEKKIFEYKTGDEIYSIGDIDHSLYTSFNEYPISDMNRVIVNHALYLAGFGGKSLSIVTGLPMKHFYKLKGMNEDLIEKKEKNLLSSAIGGKIKSLDDEVELARITKHSVLPEGVAAWMDLFLTILPDGSWQKNEEIANERIAIIDIGGRTTDIAVIKAMDVDYRRSATLDKGMLGVYDYIKNGIQDEYEAEDLDDKEIYQSLDSKTIKIFGKPQDISDIVAEAKQEALGQIYNEVKMKLGNASDIQKVYFVGGGSLIFKDIIKDWYPHNGTISEDPLFANARGMFKYSMASI